MRLEANFNLIFLLLTQILLSLFGLVNHPYEQVALTTIYLVYLDIEFDIAIEDIQRLLTEHNAMLVAFLLKHSTIML